MSTTNPRAYAVASWYAVLSMGVGLSALWLATL